MEVSTRKLVSYILIVVVLLSFCMVADSATHSTITNVVNSNDGNMIVETQNLTPFLKNSNGVATKPNYIISLWCKPSVKSIYAYKWYYRIWINYCPNCHHYNCLLVNPKGVSESELTCFICDSDFDGVTGKEKYNWSHKFLTYVF